MFVEKALFVFAESLWVVYLILAVYFLAVKFVFSKKALDNFRRLKFTHRWVFMPILIIFTFYELELGGNLDDNQLFWLVLLLIVNMVGYGMLKLAVCHCMKLLIGKMVNLIICYADDEIVEYSLLYKKKVLTHGCCARKCWGKIEVESGDMFSAVITESRPGSKQLFDVKLIE